MCAIEDAYRRLGQLLLDENLYIDRSLTFSQLCSWSGTDEEEMDRLMFSELGVTGEAYLLILRDLKRNKLKDCYGINTF